MRRTAFLAACVTVTFVPVAAPAFAAWVSSGSNAGSATATTLGAPGVPAAGTVTSSSVALSWTAAAPLGGTAPRYHVQRSPFTTGTTTWSDACSSSDSAPIAGTSCTDAGLAATTDYMYRVTATFEGWRTRSAASGKVATLAAAPAAPGTPSLSASSDTGLSQTDRITKHNLPTFSGSGATAGATVAVFSGTVQIASGTAASDGTYSVTVPTASKLADGTHAITAKQTTATGTSEASASISVTVDTVAPSAPTITTPSNGATGVSRTPSFAGSAREAGGRITVKVNQITGANSTLIGTVTGSVGTDTWSTSSFSPTLDKNKDHAASAVHQDVAGNDSPAGASVTFKTVNDNN